MQLDPAEKRSVWWKGALKSGLKETLRGLAIGVVAAGVLFGLAQFAALTPMLGPMVMTASKGFNPIIITAFCGVISGVTGLFTGGGQAVEAYHQRKHNARDEAKINELDGRTQMLEQQTALSPRVQQILERGPRSTYNAYVSEAAAPQSLNR